MAKKILAVVLAVMMAVSAMAISAFADDTKIPLYPSNGTWSTTVTNDLGFTLDLPYYALYGYTTNEFALEVNLPKKISGIDKGTSVDWYITVNGVPSQMKPVVIDDSNDLDTQYVFFAPLAHSYVADGTLWTSVPQSTGFGDTPSIRLTAAYKLNKGNANPVGADAFNANSQNGNSVNVKVVKADSVPGNATGKSLEYVPGAATYAKDWTFANQAGNTSTNPVVYDFVTNEWTVGADTATNLVNPLMFDHTFANRLAITTAWSLGSTVELHVPLDHNINGIVTYTLYAKNDASESPYWWNYSNKRQLVQQKTLDGSYNEIVFEVPVDKLYDATYQANAMNVEFVIFENILLKVDSLMSDYMRKGPGATGDGNLGDISWVSWSDIIRYKNNPVNYAHSGKAGVGVVDGYYDKVVKTKTVEISDIGGWSWSANMMHIKADELKTELGATDDQYIVISSTAPDQAIYTDNASSGNVQLGADRTKTLVIKVADLKDFDLISNAASARTTTYTIDLYNSDAIDPATGSLLVKPLPADGKVPEGYTAHMNGTGTSNAMTTGAYLLIKSEEEDSEPEKVDPPTEAPGTTDDPEQNPGDIDVGDSDEEKKDENPKTGVALALVPMMIAAAAAVVSKKH